MFMPLHEDEIAPVILLLKSLWRLESSISTLYSSHTQGPAVFLTCLAVSHLQVFAHTHLSNQDVLPFLVYLTSFFTSFLSLTALLRSNLHTIMFTFYSF